MIVITAVVAAADGWWLVAGGLENLRAAACGIISIKPILSITTSPVRK